MYEGGSHLLLGLRVGVGLVCTRVPELLQVVLLGSCLGNPRVGAWPPGGVSVPPAPYKYAPSAPTRR